MRGVVANARSALFASRTFPASGRFVLPFSGVPVILSQQRHRCRRLLIPYFSFGPMLHLTYLWVVHVYGGRWTFWFFISPFFGSLAPFVLFHL